MHIIVYSMTWNNLHKSCFCYKHYLTGYIQWASYWVWQRTAVPSFWHWGIHCTIMSPFSDYTHVWHWRRMESCIKQADKSLITYHMYECHIVKQIVKCVHISWKLSGSADKVTCAPGCFSLHLHFSTASDWQYCFATWSF